MIHWKKRWPDRDTWETSIRFEGVEDRIQAVVYIPRHRDTYHVVIWDEQIDPEQYTITNTEGIINHPGWTDVNEAKDWATRYLMRIRASEAGDA